MSKEIVDAGMPPIAIFFISAMCAAALEIVFFSTEAVFALIFPGLLLFLGSGWWLPWKTKKRRALTLGVSLGAFVAFFVGVRIQFY
jgi:hypothetical protein